MKNKTKNILQTMGIVATFSMIWIIGVLIYGEIVLADTLCFGSLFGKEYENLFALTPIFILLTGLIFTIIAKRKQSKEIFIASEVMLLLPIPTYLLALLLVSTESFLALIGLIIFLPAAPALTCLGCIDNFIEPPFIPYIVVPILYTLISLSYIFIYKFKNMQKNLI